MEGPDTSLWAGPPRRESLVGGVARGWDSGQGCFWALGGASGLQSAVRSAQRWKGRVWFPVLLPSPLQPAPSVMAQQPPDVEEDDCLSEYHHLFCPDLLQ